MDMSIFFILSKFFAHVVKQGLELHETKEYGIRCDDNTWLNLKVKLTGT